MLLEQCLALLELHGALLERSGDALELAVELPDLALELGKVPLDHIDLVPDLPQQLPNAIVFGGDGSQLGTGEVERVPEVRRSTLE